MFWDVIKVIAYFVVCIAIIWLSMRAAKIYAGGGAGRFAATRYIKLLDKMVFGKDSGIGIIQVGEKYMLISITSGRIEKLCELTEDDLVDFREEAGAVNIYDAVKNSISPSAAKAFEKMKGRKKTKKAPKKGDFSKLLYENADKEDIEFSTIRDRKNDETDSIVDELLKSSEERTREFRGKTSNR